MRRLLILPIALLIAAALLPAAADAKGASHGPAVTSVRPMRVKVGHALTLRGRHFSSSRRRNTVIFSGSNGRTVFAKPSRSSGHKLVVKVPRSAERILSTRSGSRTPTRVKLRVLVKRRFSRWTPRRLSPVVVSSSRTGSSTGGSASCTSGTDSDHDLLSNAQEAALKLDPCNRDTDGDGVDDGYEYQSALDLNHYVHSSVLPYPGKRPYPNPLDPSDAQTDYDGDGLALRDEYLLWSRFSADGVARQGRPTTLSNLLYSDGLQESVDPPPAAPASGTLARWALDIDGNGQLSDDERDGDGDGLSNWDESHGRMLVSWWVAEHNGTIEPKESKYPGVTFPDNETLSSHDALADPDIDGDGVKDGADDTDHDGLSNQFEVQRPSDWLIQAFAAYPGDMSPGANPWAYVQPFNPCKPYRSARCHSHPPFGYYATDEVPPIGPNPPAGYPNVHPTTPNG
jgi:hypothetical protein